jgi:hypothetical protein
MQINKPDLVLAILPHLIALQPSPPQPDANQAKECLDAAIGWAEHIAKLAAKN